MLRGSKQKNLGLTMAGIHLNMLDDFKNSMHLLEDVINTIKKFNAIGYTHFILTPQQSSSYEVINKRSHEFKENCQLLQAAVSNLNTSIKIEFTEKYTLDDNLVDKLNQGLNFRAFGNKKYLFLNAPSNLKFENLIYAFFTLKVKDYQPILLQSPTYLTKNSKRYYSFKRRSHLFYLNLRSLVGYDGWMNKRRTNKLLKDTRLLKFLGIGINQYNQVEKIIPTFHKLALEYVSTTEN